LQAVLAARGDISADICAVVSNVADAPALDHARAAGVPAAVIPHRDFATREAFDHALVAHLREARADVVLLAGFMRMLTAVYCGAFPLTLNVHPSLLPAFPGAHAVRDALAYGAKVTGVTVHFVELALDAGPIIAQEAVPILPDDDEASLHARLQRVEHRLVPQAVATVCAGKAQIRGRQVVLA
jgi:phosphoribosylglycinamide formyltransferase-1